MDIPRSAACITFPMPTKPRVLVTEGSDAEPLQWLREQADVAEVGPTDPRFAAELALAEGMVVRTYTKVNVDLLAKAPKLRAVGRGGVGIENIDVPACRARGIEVVYTPDANTLAVGDFVFGYLLQILRPWNFFKDAVYEPKEFKRIRDTVRGRQLNELTIGVLGMGRVGRRVGHIAAHGFGMRVIYHDVQDVAAHLDFPATDVDPATLYREADVLTIHVDMRPGNHNLVGAAQLSQMKPTAVLVNTSRARCWTRRRWRRRCGPAVCTGRRSTCLPPSPRRPTCRCWGSIACCSRPTWRPARAPPWPT